jgi:histone acetyltransferase
MGSLTQYGSDDEDDVLDLLNICNCGHDVPAHGANISEIGSEEFARRGRVAVRLDELLQVCLEPWSHIEYDGV